jgi:cytoskeletal protein CcmA (bactofilin family)
VKWKGEPSGDLSGFLDKDMVMKGEISFKETLRIDGRFEGTIRSGKNLIVGESADVDAEIEVDSLYVSGTLRGSARAKERIELASTARVQANLSTSTLCVEEGALFTGHCSMGQSSGPREVGARPIELKKVTSS